jgi:hypothetical protein
LGITERREVSLSIQPFGKTCTRGYLGAQND